MRLAINIGYWGPKAALDMELIAEAERLGYDSVWAAEAWGSDAVTVLSWIAARTERIKVGSAILQMPARTPAMTAMTAVTLNELSDGRFLLGLGLSGPQVVEGWHGVPYGKPLRRTREYVAVVRMITERRHPARFAGEYYQLPYRGEDATGLGKPLKLITHPTYAVPIYLASIGPKNVQLTAEIADGWLPVFYSPYRAGEVFGPAMAAGFAASGEPDKATRFDVAPAASVVVSDDVDAARALVKPGIAFYVGGMGARGRNFYNDLARRYGFEAEAERIQDLYLDGKRRDAIAAVPDALVDEVALVGPRARVADRLEAWREAGVTTLSVSAPDITTLRALAEIAL